jgi:hypothetical protein
MMDQRTTFKDVDQLMDIINVVFKEKGKASFIIDKEGLTRMEGLITNVEQNTSSGRTVVHLQPSNYFHLDEVIAINGIFRSDYSEC